MESALLAVLLAKEFGSRFVRICVAFLRFDTTPAAQEFLRKKRYETLPHKRPKDFPIGFANGQFQPGSTSTGFGAAPFGVGHRELVQMYVVGHFSPIRSGSCRIDRGAAK
jgi:hypothetical protein